jgi:hypothetical protein
MTPGMWDTGLTGQFIGTVISTASMLRITAMRVNRRVRE